MKFWQKLALTGGVAAAVSVVGAAVAGADEQIDYGIKKVECEAAAQQANTSGNGHSYCYETESGHYMLFLAS